MSRKKAEYAIHELAQKAYVSVRTVRFYINEGLLPPPQTRGRYAVYTDEYLDRLELIRRLKESFLPLKEIRATLMSLSGDEVRASLADLRKREADAQLRETAGEKTGPAHKDDEARSRALEYIADLLSSTPVDRPLPPNPIQYDAKQKAMPDALQEWWQRVTLAPGLELHIRQPLPTEDQTKIDAIVEFAKKTFKS